MADSSSSHPQSPRRDPHSPSPDPQRSKSLNILCLDGGGVRGISELLILQHIIMQLQNELNSTKTPLPCEIFDLICGTSTGGLIAIMLGRLRMSVDDALLCYLQLSKETFGRKRPLRRIRTQWASIGRLFGKPTYSARILEGCIKEVVGRHEEPDAPLKDRRVVNMCPTFVVAVYASPGDSSKLFRTYETPHDAPDDSECTIWEAARATTAAVTFFSPVSIGSPPQKFVDGALGGSNNPSLLALTEIGWKFPRRKIGCFVSLGTGVPKAPTWHQNIFSAAKSSFKVLTSCARVDSIVETMIEQKESTSDALPDAYIRLSVNTDRLADIALDEYDRADDLTVHTSNYLNQSEPQAMVHRYVGRLTVSRAREVHVD